MASTINASTASGGGVITTADASGILQLQTAGVTGLTIDASQNVTFAKVPTNTTAQSMVRLNTTNGYGSTNTKIRRFTNVVTNQGSDITYADSATLGGSFTINTSGVYCISYSDIFSGPSHIGLSLNTTTPTTSVYLCAVAEILIVSVSNGVNAVSTSWSGYLTSGNIVRAHNDGVTSGSETNSPQFTIVRVA